MYGNSIHISWDSKSEFKLSTGFDRTLQDKALRKNPLTVIVQVMEMVLVLLVLRQFPMPLLSNDQIILGYLITALFQMLLAMWLMKIHG